MHGVREEIVRTVLFYSIEKLQDHYRLMKAVIILENEDIVSFI